MQAVNGLWVWRREEICARAIAVGDEGANITWLLGLFEFLLGIA